MTHTGYLLINLGTPASTEIADVRAYLKQFLMDPYVLDVPTPIRRLIVNGFILPFRPKKSAAAYASIWEPEGSPLLVECRALETEMQTALEAPTVLGMRYGEPSLEHAVQSLISQGVKRIVMVPLYPQYADSTITTSVAEVQRLVPASIETCVVPPFFADSDYISALSETVRQALPAQWDHVLMSYHGLPERHLRKADPTGEHCLGHPDCCQRPSTAHDTCYRHQVYGTSRALAEALGLSESEYTVSFQSRLGGGWMQPYTDKVLAELPAQGIRRLVVVCPAFVADNLETLEEMGMQGRETFLAAGGEHFELIPCLNHTPAWVRALTSIIHQFEQDLN